VSAILSACGLYRYRLERSFAAPADWPTYAFFGVNGSTADATRDDHTVRKWIGFCRTFKAKRFVVGNAFAFRATDVRELALAADPIGPANDRYLAEIIAEAMSSPYEQVVRGITQVGVSLAQLNEKLASMVSTKAGDGHHKDERNPP